MAKRLINIKHKLRRTDIKTRDEINIETFSKKNFKEDCKLESTRKQWNKWVWV